MKNKKKFLIVVFIMFAAYFSLHGITYEKAVFENTLILCCDNQQCDNQHCLKTATWIDTDGSHVLGTCHTCLSLSQSGPQGVVCRTGPSIDVYDGGIWDGLAQKWPVSVGGAVGDGPNHLISVTASETGYVTDGTTVTFTTSPTRITVSEAPGIDVYCFTHWSEGSSSITVNRAINNYPVYQMFYDIE